MKDMAATQAGMSFYAELPDNYNLVVNTSNPVVKKILDDAEKSLDDKLNPLRTTIKDNNEKISAIRGEIKDNKPTPEQEKEEKSLIESVENTRKEQEKIVSDYTEDKPVIKQAIDLALLANGLLRGRELSEFIRRSVSLL